MTVWLAASHDESDSKAVETGSINVTSETIPEETTPAIESFKPPMDTSIANDLPTEILVEIFMQLMLDGIDTMSSRWIRVSHVCSRWRNIALQCPQLWSWPSFRTVPCAEAMIARAQHLPLHIVINFSKFFKSSGLWKPFASLVQAESLDMKGFLYPRHWDFFGEYFRGRALAAPLLRSLFVKVSDRHHNPYSNKRLSHGFSLAAPELRHLTIHTWGLCGSPVKLASCPRLTSLEIRSTGGVAKLQDSMWEILDNLRHLQQLEELRLFHAFRHKHASDDKDRPEDGSYDVFLPAIKRIEVQDKHRACRVFFECFSYPDHGVTVTVNCIEAIEEAVQDAAAAEIRELLKATSRRLADPIRVLHVLPLPQRLGSAKNPFSINLWTMPSSTEADYVDSPATITIHAPFIPTIFEGICETLPLRNLEHFVYSLDRAYSPMWRDIGALEHVWLLHVTFAHYSLFKALMAPWGAQLDIVRSKTPTEDNSVQPPSPAVQPPSPAIQSPPPAVLDQPPLYFKALRDLSLYDWRFENFRHPWIDTHVLAKGLAKRREHGCGLTNLQIWGCGGFMYEDMEELVKVVDEVYWDEDDLIESIGQLVIEDNDSEHAVPTQP